MYICCIIPVPVCVYPVPEVHLHVYLYCICGTYMYIYMYPRMYENLENLDCFLRLARPSVLNVKVPSVTNVTWKQ